MSVLQGKNIDGFTQIASNYDPKPNRRISDNFTSSRSYTPDRKCMVIFSSNHDIEKYIRVLSGLLAKIIDVLNNDE
jgi:hypothetical protein